MMKTVSKAMAWVALLLALGLAYLLWAPAPVEPVTWEVAPNPGLEGPYKPNEKLAVLTKLLEGVGVGPEAVACGVDGTLYTGYADGRILRFGPDGDFTELANTGGRPLGMKVGADGNLVVADAKRGLLSVGPNSEVEVLVDEVHGQKLVFADDIDIARDGTLWFSDASNRFGYDQSMYNFLEGQASGRLLSFSPGTGATEVHMSNLFFANGVTLGPNEEYVLVNETGTGRIHRLWLAGELAGQSDLFHEGLPGTPDNITFNGEDTFWVAMPQLRSPGLDDMASLPLLRKLLSRLPMETLNNVGTPYSFVLGLNLEGEVVHNLQDSKGSFADITSANECFGHLFLGSLTMGAVGRYAF